MADLNPRKYPLLEEFLEIQHLSLKPIYTTKDAAQVFGVTPRAVEDWIKSGKMIARDLLGHGRFLPIDLEDYLRNSKKLS
ncbi:MAG: helix-turn-helix domain-containing protein [Acidobacteriaceae bacterium]|jgi:predicted DNA-binding protein (UPF0251 family)